MISADARQESQRISAATHHDAYLMKPLQLSTLFETLKNLLNLEWRYDAIVHAAPAQLNMRALDAAHIPPAEHLLSLRYLGQIGHMRGILSKLDEIGQTHPATAPVVSYLRDLAEACDLERYGDTLEALSADER
jgi:hypothetical protein